MIYLEQNDEMYNNDIRAMLQAFFDNEKVVTVADGTRISLQVNYKDNFVAYKLSDENGYEDEAGISIDYTDKGIARNPLKAVLYRLLSAYTKKELPWGGMTGVRPTKIATKLLEDGMSEGEIHKVYTDTYLTIDQKADICIEVA